MLNPFTLFRQALPPRALNLAFIRHESSSRRLTKRLRLPPHEDFQFSANSPSINHILHNPPPSAPSVYLTPSLFLPKDDPRRSFPPPNPTTDQGKLPPALTPPREKSYHLTPKDFKKMRALRGSNPSLWNRKRLAEKFGTTQFFAGMVAEASEKQKKKAASELQRVKDGWGQRRANARRDRARRREGWGGLDGY